MPEKNSVQIEREKQHFDKLEPKEIFIMS